MYSVPIELGKLREFARAALTDASGLGDAAPIPPTFLTTARLVWEPPSSRQALIDAIGFDPRRVLHAEEEYRFFGDRPRAGEVLQAESRLGETWTKTNRAGQELRFAQVVTTFRRTPDSDPAAEQRTTIVETAAR